MRAFAMEASTKVELTRLAKWRMVLLRRDPAPVFQVLAKQH